MNHPVFIRCGRPRLTPPWAVEPMLRPTPMKHVRLLVIEEDLPRASLTLTGRSPLDSRLRKASARLPASVRPSVNRPSACNAR